MVIPVVPLLQGCRQERQEFKVILSCLEFEASLGYVRPHLKETKEEGLGRLFRVKCLPSKNEDLSSDLQCPCLFCFAFKARCDSVNLPSQH